MPHPSRPLALAVPFAALTALALAACSNRLGLGTEGRDAPSAAPSDAGADAESTLLASEQRPPEGAPDQGRDPALVMLSGPARDCTATFVAKDVLLTARACVEDAMPESLTIRVGDEPGGERAASGHGIEIVVGDAQDPAEDDIAFVVLDAAFPTMQPLGMRGSGVALNARVRTVGHSSGTETRAFGARLVREHVRVRGETDGAFYVAELGCRFFSGGPALDEATGQILGVLVAPGDTCDGDDASNRYVRMERFADLYDRALSRSGLGALLASNQGVMPPDGRPRGASRPGSHKPPSEVGSTCETGADCATGLCMMHEDRAYCSRACGFGDRCPATYHCEDAPGASATSCVLAP